MFDGQPKEVIIYETADHVRPLDVWRTQLRDLAARARIEKRVNRLLQGNPGDYKSVGNAVYEMRIDFGPGYRLYFAFAERQIVLLLCGGSKATQAADIKDAQLYWDDYQKRVKR